MGNIFEVVQTTGLGNTPASAAETAIFTTPVLPPVGQASVQNPVTIQAVVNALAGTGTTALVMRCRQGSGVAGTQVGPAVTQTVAAGATANVPFQWPDTSGYLEGGGQYTITLSATGASGAGTSNAVSVEVSI